MATDGMTRQAKSVGFASAETVVQYDSDDSSAGRFASRPSRYDTAPGRLEDPEHMDELLERLDDLLQTVEDAASGRNIGQSRLGALGERLTRISMAFKAGSGSSSSRSTVRNARSTVRSTVSASCRSSVNELNMEDDFPEPRFNSVFISNKMEECLQRLQAASFSEDADDCEPPSGRSCADMEGGLSDDFAVAGSEFHPSASSSASFQEATLRARCVALLAELAESRQQIERLEETLRQRNSEAQRADAAEEEIACLRQLLEEQGSQAAQPELGPVLDPNDVSSSPCEQCLQQDVASAITLVSSRSSVPDVSASASSASSVIPEEVEIAARELQNGSDLILANSRALEQQTTQIVELVQSLCLARNNLGNLEQACLPKKTADDDRRSLLQERDEALAFACESVHRTKHEAVQRECQIARGEAFCREEEASAASRERDAANLGESRLRYQRDEALEELEALQVEGEIGIISRERDAANLQIARLEVERDVLKRELEMQRRKTQQAIRCSQVARKEKTQLNRRVQSLLKSMEHLVEKTGSPRSRASGVMVE